jgi:hypothetical protein
MSTVRYNPGFAAIPDEIIKDERTTAYHIALFALLAMHANQDGRAWPSIKRIATTLGCSRNKAKQTIAELRDMGGLTVDHRWDEGSGQYGSNIYTLSRSLQGRSYSDPGVGHEVTKGRSPGGQEPNPLEPNPLGTNNTSTSHFEAEFEEAWKDYPRKIGKKAALKGYIAKRRKGVSKADLLRAVHNYARTVSDTELRFIMQGSTFFGPNDRYQDYTHAPEARSRKATSVADQAEWDEIERLAHGQ